MEDDELIKEINWKKLEKEFPEVAKLLLHILEVFDNLLKEENENGKDETIN